jgi:hypothetical protein
VQAGQYRRRYLDTTLRLHTQFESERGPIRFHLLVIDGAYLLREDALPYFAAPKHLIEPHRLQVEILVEQL